MLYLNKGDNCIMILNCLLDCAIEDDIRGWISRDCDIVWNYVANNKQRNPVNLSEQFMRELKDYIHWSKTWGQLKSIDFIRENADKLNWELLSKYYPFTQAQLKEFENRINWEYVAGWNELDKLVDVNYFLDKLACQDLLSNWTIKLDKDLEFKARVYAYGEEFLQNVRKECYR